MRNIRGSFFLYQERRVAIMKVNDKLESRKYMNRIHKKTVVLVAAAAVLLTGCRVSNPKEKDELAFRKSGIVFWEKGQYEKAAKTFQKALDCSNGRISDVEYDICYYKAYSLIQAGKKDEAIEVYDAILNYDKKQWQAWMQKGNVYASMGKYQEACNCYNRATDMTEGNFEACISIYENLKAVKATEEMSESYLRKALKYKNDDGESIRNKGRIYLLLKEYDNAKQTLSEAMNKGDEEAKLYMAQVLEATKDKDGAYAIYESYANAHKEDGAAQFRLVKMLMEEEEYEKALKYVNEAKKNINEDNEKELLTCEISAYEHLQKFEEAKKLLEEFLKKYPMDDKAKKELQFVTSRITKTEE